MKDSVYIKVRKRVTYEVYVRKFRRDPVRPGDVVFLGDSITAQGDWAEWFDGAAAGGGDQRVVVRGIGGDSVAGVLGRLDAVVDRPAKLFLMIGTNDVWLGSPPDVIVEQIGQIVTAIRSRTPSTTLYVQSVTPRSGRLASAIRAVNDGLRVVAAGAGATYVELFDLLCDADGGLRPGFSVDELHLQPPAYDIWREAVRPLVEA